MAGFIHTFSVRIYLSESEKDMLASTYREDFFFNNKEGILVLSRYAENGLRIHIRFNSAKEKRYDKKHRDYKIELIINPAKLLYPKESMKKLFTEEEYTLAYEKLEELLQEIKRLSGVWLWNETKIYRLDIATDVETESDEYSKEVIRLSKLALDKTGYHLWSPTQEDIEKYNWEETDSAMFYNHNQEVNAKIYNKLEDLKKQDYKVDDIKGLIRFELALKRKYLKNNGFITKDFIEIPELKDQISAVYYYIYRFCERIRTDEKEANLFASYYCSYQEAENDFKRDFVDLRGKYGEIFCDKSAVKLHEDFVVVSAYIYVLFGKHKIFLGDMNRAERDLLDFILDKLGKQSDKKSKSRRPNTHEDYALVQKTAANLDRKILSNMKNDKWEEFYEYQRKKLWTLIKALIEEYPDDEDSSIIHKDYTRINKYFRVNFEGRLEELLAELELKLKFPYVYKVSRYLELLYPLYGNSDEWKVIEDSIKKENLRSIERKLKEITGMHKMLLDERPVNE